jgi:hypothetical protein
MHGVEQEVAYARLGATVSAFNATRQRASLRQPFGARRTLQEPVDCLSDLAIVACVAFGQACASSRSSRIGASYSTVPPTATCRHPHVISMCWVHMLVPMPRWELLSRPRRAGANGQRVKAPLAGLRLSRNQIGGTTRPGSATGEHRHALY